jgi:hypothetical protein
MARGRIRTSSKASQPETDRAVSKALRERRMRELGATRLKTPVLDSFEELVGQLKRSAGRRG